MRKQNNSCPRISVTYNFDYPGNIPLSMAKDVGLGRILPRPGRTTPRHAPRRAGGGGGGEGELELVDVHSF